MADMTDIWWDRLYVFGPYTRCERIVREVGDWSFWFPCRRSGVEDSDGIALLVLVRSGGVAAYVIPDTEQGDFRYAFRAGGYSRYEARFTVGDRGRVIWMGSL